MESSARSEVIEERRGSQRVRVVPEVEAYPNESVDLRCQFAQGVSSTTKLTQVSWIWEPMEGEKRENIAVYHPIYGKSFPESPFSNRVEFLPGPLESPSIQVKQLKMADAGRYTCEFATYPSGNEQGTTTLIMLCNPKNSASPVTVQAGTKPVVVAQCAAVDGKPAADILWQTTVPGNHSITSKEAADGTVTVRSEFRMVPTAADHGKELTCVVTQRTQDVPQSFPMKLSVEYPPTASIQGYDENWYRGRSEATLVCETNSNPPASVTWTSLSGPMPDTVRIEGNRLIVRTVDETVNTTFVCEVKNRLGVGKHQLTTIVIEPSVNPSSAGVVAGAIISSILALLLVGALIGVLINCSRRQRRAGGGYPGNGDLAGGAYGNKARLFGSGKNGGAGPNNNGPIYTYRENQLGALGDKASNYRTTGTGTDPAPSAHNILLSSEMDEVERRKFNHCLDDSLEEEEERYDSFGVNMATAYHIGRGDEEMAVYLDDDMESQRDGSVISRTAIYV
ncbi:LOW QUALITY PROTEIN: PVR cell adhesion molecule related 2 like [Osmerus mordax]|uniref:LOW QUALITY PROTEIN: PVR cell adhesion molecule related 2 like n=1 Tax=Osmerus mordax TaxID=8014 RepID=UPI00350FE89A